jgi:hypothetical protein
MHQPPSPGPDSGAPRLPVPLPEYLRGVVAAGDLEATTRIPWSTPGALAEVVALGLECCATAREARPTVRACLARLDALLARIPKTRPDGGPVRHTRESKTAWCGVVAHPAFVCPGLCVWLLCWEAVCVRLRV